MTSPARVAPRSADEGQARLHVDRSFSLKGIGTVVTGTLWSGSLARGDRVAVLPRGLEARVRSVEVHDEQVEQAVAGQRVALNLAGVARDEVARGDVVASSGSELQPTWLVDARLSLEPGVAARARYARARASRDARGARRAWCRSRGPTWFSSGSRRSSCPAAGDRLVIRQVAPPDTIGGGEVVDPLPRKHSRLPAGPPHRSRERRVGRRAANRSQTPHVLDDRALQLAALLDSDGFEPRADGELAQAVGVEGHDARRLWSRAGACAAGRCAWRTTCTTRRRRLPSSSAGSSRSASGRGATTIAAVRDELGTSRRYAQALLEHLDATKVTIRRGDEHVLRRR